MRKGFAVQKGRVVNFWQQAMKKLSLYNSSSVTFCAEIHSPLWEVSINITQVPLSKHKTPAGGIPRAHYKRALSVLSPSYLFAEKMKCANLAVLLVFLQNAIALNAATTTAVTTTLHNVVRCVLWFSQALTYSCFLSLFRLLGTSFKIIWGKFSDLHSFCGLSAGSKCKILPLTNVLGFNYKSENRLHCFKKPKFCLQLGKCNSHRESE